MQGLSPNRLWSVGHRVKGSLMTIIGAIGLAALVSLCLTFSYVDTTKAKQESDKGDESDK